MNRKVIVFAPHPDDEVIGCGGTMAKHTANGDAVYVIYITSRLPATTQNETDSAGLSDYEQESHSACNVLGVEKCFFLRKRSRYFSYDENTVVEIITIVREVEPDIVYVPHPDEGDREHRITYELAREALWLAASPYLPECGKMCPEVDRIYLYEVWTPLQTFQRVEDISSFIDVKTEALRKYRSGLASKRYDEAIVGLNRYRGEMTGSGRYAEAFAIAICND